MSYKLILPNKIIVQSDVKLEIGDLCYGEDINSDFIDVHEAGSHDIWLKNPKVIAGYKNELPWIDFSLVREFVEQYGLYDVKKLAEEAVSKFKNGFDGILNEGNLSLMDFFFQEGFKFAQTLSEKKFNEEDVVECWNTAFLQQGTYDQLIERLSQPKIFEVELEMEDVSIVDQVCVNKRPKITRNLITITKIL